MPTGKVVPIAGHRSRSKGRLDTTPKPVQFPRHLRVTLIRVLFEKLPDQSKSLEEQAATVMAKRFSYEQDQHCSTNNNNAVLIPEQPRDGQRTSRGGSAFDIDGILTRAQH